MRSKTIIKQYIEEIMSIKRIAKLIDRILYKANRLIEQGKYNKFTISEYYRQQGAQIGENCIIVPKELGTEPYLVKIGNHVSINQGVRLHTHDGGTWIFREEIPDLRVFGPIIIEDNCLIGEYAHILPNVTIGKNSIVAAGSVVITDVKPNSIVMGIPARPFGSVEKYKQKCMDRWEIQKPPNFHPDGKMSYEESKHKDLILEQLRNHLCNVFKEKLAK